MSSSNLMPKDRFEKEVDYLLKIESQAKNIIETANKEASNIVIEAEKKAGEIDITVEQEADMEVKKYENQIEKGLAAFKEELDGRYQNVSKKIEETARAKRSQAIDLILKEVVTS